MAEEEENLTCSLLVNCKSYFAPALNQLENRRLKMRRCSAKWRRQAIVDDSRRKGRSNLQSFSHF